VPEQLLVDTGSIDCSQEITLIGPRVGCLLRHTPVRDAAAKGKIERFFRRVRDQFLIQKLDLSSLEALNRRFTHWVENDYNATEHGWWPQGDDSLSCRTEYHSAPRWLRRHLEKEEARGIKSEASPSKSPKRQNHPDLWVPTHRIHSSKIGPPGTLFE
jgi:transposase InsO family protein